MGRAPLLLSSTSGVAAAEMALITPLFVTLMFGSFELGKYFLDEHVVVKAARDGARYAARRSYSDYTCGSASTAAVAAIRNITRTQQVTGGGTARLSYWTDPATVTVTASCNTSGTYTGIYRGIATGVPIVTVTVSVPYTSLFNSLGFAATSLSLNAQSQATVSGI